MTTCLPPGFHWNLADESLILIGLRKSFDLVRAVDQVSLKFLRGHVVGIISRSGATVG